MGDGGYRVRGRWSVGHRTPGFAGAGGAWDVDAASSPQESPAGGQVAGLREWNSVACHRRKQAPCRRRAYPCPSLRAAARRDGALRGKARVGCLADAEFFPRAQGTALLLETAGMTSRP